MVSEVEGRSRESSGSLEPHPYVVSEHAGIEAASVALAGLACTEGRATRFLGIAKVAAAGVAAAVASTWAAEATDLCLKGPTNAVPDSHSACTD